MWVTRAGHFATPQITVPYKSVKSRDLVIRGQRWPEQSLTRQVEHITRILPKRPRLQPKRGAAKDESGQGAKPQQKMNPLCIRSGGATKGLTRKIWE